MTTATLPSIAEAESLAFAILSNEPGTARIMDSDSVTEEWVLGKGKVPEDDDPIADQIYDLFEVALDNLYDQELLETGVAFSIRTYWLSEAGWAKLKADQN